jgi:uncharacterized protein (AIM24 family)
MVEIELDPGETVIVEASALVYMEQDISFKVKFGDGSTPNKRIFGKPFQAGSRLITGESLFITHFTQKGNGKGKVAFAAPYPGTIIPIDLSQVNHSLIVEKNGFLCAALDTLLSVYLKRHLILTLKTQAVSDQCFLEEKVCSWRH